MSLDLAAAAQGLAQTITAGCPGLNVYWFPVDSPRWPCVQVEVRPGTDSVVYRETFGARGRVSVKWQLTVQVSAVSPESALTAIYALLSTGTENSIFDAAEESPTWQGSVEVGWLTVASAPRPVQRDDGVQVWEAVVYAESIGVK